MNNSDFAFIAQFLKDRSGLIITQDKMYLLETRLTSILRENGLADLTALVELLRQPGGSKVKDQVVDAMTTNETSFFRDNHPFETLRKSIIPGLIERRAGTRALRIWSAACSTGQEGYSLAMLLLEHFPTLATWNIRIEGTDISNEVVDKARAGNYHRIEINRGLPARFVVRYFDHQGEDWTIKSEVRRMCNFRQANLCAPQLPFNRIDDRFDIVFLRNVMLYFSQETRRTLLAGIHRLLPQDGVLFLGSSEQPADPSLWTPILAGGTCYFKPRQPS